jgi:hypothetical protein
MLFFWGVKPSSGLKMEAVCSAETSVSTYKSTRRYNPEDQHRHRYDLKITENEYYNFHSFGTENADLEEHWHEVCIESFCIDDYGDVHTIMNSAVVHIPAG